MRVTVGGISFLPGALLRLRVEPEAEAEELPEVHNISVDLLRFNPQRDRGAFGFGGRPINTDGALEISHNLPLNLGRGLYVVRSIVVSCGEDPENCETRRHNIEPVYFYVRPIVQLPLTANDLSRIVNDLARQRANYLRGPIRTDAIVQGGAVLARFRVLIFGVGCLLDGPHQLSGFTLVPMRSGFSHERLLQIVNAELAREAIEAIPFNDDTEREFEANTPTFLVDYPMVEAIDHQDAIEHCRRHSGYLFRILGLERGQMPEEFAVFALEYESNRRWHLFRAPFYQGNLLANFDPARTADSIDRLMPKLQEKPFVRLLVATYSDATKETDYGFKLLRFWTVLELVADRVITGPVAPILHPDGTPILNSRRNPKRTNSKDGRVYAYILQSGAFQQNGRFQEGGVQRTYLVGCDATHPAFRPGAELLSLWDMVCAAYAIRNAIAHEGQFDVTQAQAGTASAQLAARLKLRGAPDPLKYVENQATLALWRETSRI